MIKKFTILSGMMLALVSFTPSVQAIPITGTVVITGGTTLTPVGSPLGTATGVAATTGSVFGGTGSFSGTSGAAVTFQGFTFQPVTTPVNSLWTFTVGTFAYSFDLKAMFVNSDTPSFLDISGTGWLSITGTGSTYDVTPGTWTYQINSTDPNGLGGVFSYQSSNTAIPDGGVTVMLLGVALSGLYFFRKQILA